MITSPDKIYGQNQVNGKYSDITPLKYNGIEMSKVKSVIGLKDKLIEKFKNK